MSVSILKPLNRPQSNWFIYGDYMIFYQKSARAINNKIQIQVNPNADVIVKIPKDITPQSLTEALNKRQRWIYNQVTEFRTRSEFDLPKQYISGESLFYLGRRHMLKVNQTDSSGQKVKLLHGRLEVWTTDKSKVKALIDTWYKQRAKKVFQKRLLTMLDKTPWVKQKPPMRTMRMKTQWGSCSPKGLITLNPYLVKAPTICIDYVILHELCHIAEHNHSENFYRLMNQVMPEWKKIKAQLDGNAGKYLE